MKTKFLLPVLAIVFAVGMSFKTVDNLPVTTAYINLNGVDHAIQTNPCEGGNLNCQVLVEGLPNPGPYILYMDKDFQHPYKSNSPTPHVISN